MNTASTKTAELTDRDLEAISGGCYRREDDYGCHKKKYECDDDYDYGCEKKESYEDDYDYGCKDDYDYGCHERPRHCRPRHHCW